MSERPKLRSVPLADVLPVRPGVCYCTMSEGQWDTLLQAAYDLHFVLLELDDEERLLRAYRKGRRHE
jgi:hypothetical protein